MFMFQGFDDMRLNISYVFYMKDIFKDYSNVLKSINTALLFINVYAINDMKGLVKTSERSSTPCSDSRIP